MNRLVSGMVSFRQAGSAGRCLISYAGVLLCCLFILCGFAGDICAEDWREVFLNDPAVRKTFQSGLKDYRDGDFARAERKFHSLLPADKAGDEEAVSLFVAKCLLAQKLYSEAETWLATCREEYPGGTYEDIFAYLSGHAAYFAGHPGQAAAFYLQSYRDTKDNQLKELIVASLTPLFARWLDETDLRRLADRISDGPLAAEFYFQSGKRQEKSGRYTLAEKSYREVIRQGRGSGRYHEAKEQVTKLQNRRKHTTRIGLLCPATGPLAEFGEQMSKAARLAAETWHQDHGGYIEIVLEDTHGDPLQASIAARRLVDDGVAAVVGPLTSESAVAAANVFSCAQLLHILPVASQYGLTGLSESLCQLSSTPDAVGETLARYAVDILGDSTFAILAPDEPYGHRIGRAFQKTAVQKGAIVFPTQYCRPGQTDYGTELMRIKRIILREMYDSTVFFTEDGDTLDEEQVAVHLGGFLLPGDADDLNDILPQLRFYNIFAQYLGTDGWSHPARLSRSQKFLEGSIFASPEYHPIENPRRSRFLSGWKNRYPGEPGLVATRTYDGVMLAVSVLLGLESISAGADSKPAVFNGASGRMEFSEFRANMFVPLYGYRGGHIVPADEFFVPEPDSTNR